MKFLVPLLVSAVTISPIYAYADEVKTKNSVIKIGFKIIGAPDTSELLSVNDKCCSKNFEINPQKLHFNDQINQSSNSSNSKFTDSVINMTSNNSDESWVSLFTVNGVSIKHSGKISFSKSHLGKTPAIIAEYELNISTDSKSPQLKESFKVDGVALIPIDSNSHEIKIPFTLGEWNTSKNITSLKTPFYPPTIEN